MRRSYVCWCECLLEFWLFKEVVLAESVRELGKMAFFNCFNIEQINKPRAMSIAQFEIAELPLYYNKEYTLSGNLLILNK